MEYESPRLVPRYSFVIDIEVTDLHSETQLRERTISLSLFGCGVNTLKPFPKGTRVRIKLSHGGADVAALARVAYARPELGMGVVFTTVEPENERTLQGWIAELMSNPIALPEVSNSEGSNDAVRGFHRHSRRKGKPLSAARRTKLSATVKGKPRTPETRAKIGAALKGKPLSPEHRAKLSAAKKGKNHPFFGKLLSPEHRAKLSAAAKEREARKRMSVNPPSSTSPSSVP